jgi:hypothetical protein
MTITCVPVTIETSSLSTRAKNALRSFGHAGTATRFDVNDDFAAFCLAAVGPKSQTVYRPGPPVFDKHGRRREMLEPVNKPVAGKVHNAGKTVVAEICSWLSGGRDVIEEWIMVAYLNHEVFSDAAALHGELQACVPDDAILPVVKRWAVSPLDALHGHSDTITVRVHGVCRGRVVAE